MVLRTPLAALIFCIFGFPSDGAEHVAGSCQAFDTGKCAAGEKDEAAMVQKVITLEQRGEFQAHENVDPSQLALYANVDPAQLSLPAAIAAASFKREQEASPEDQEKAKNAEKEAVEKWMYEKAKVAYNLQAARAEAASKNGEGNSEEGVEKEAARETEREAAAAFETTNEAKLSEFGEAPQAPPSPKDQAAYAFQEVTNKLLKLKAWKEKQSLPIRKSHRVAFARLQTQLSVVLAKLSTFLTIEYGVAFDKVAKRSAELQSLPYSESNEYLKAVIAVKRAESELTVVENGQERFSKAKDKVLEAVPNMDKMSRGQEVKKFGEFILIAKDSLRTVATIAQIADKAHESKADQLGGESERNPQDLKALVEYHEVAAAKEVGERISAQFNDAYSTVSTQADSFFTELTQSEQQRAAKA